MAGMTYSLKVEKERDMSVAVMQKKGRDNVRPASGERG